jgi:O-antigen/teichoic acid export membrane protein
VVVIAVVMYAAAPLLLVPLFGSQYDGAQQTIAAMALLAFVQAAEIAPGRVMLAANLQVARAALLACSAFVCVLLVFIAIPTWGVHAAIAATSLAYLLLVVSYLHALRSASRARTHTEALPNTT